jgi:putative spermidine/putrescine transport system permease protein
MKAPWNLFLMPPLAISLLLLVGSQLVFLRGSLHLDLGMGQLGAALSLGNFADIFNDTYYLRSLWLSLGVSAAATVLSVLVAFPVAYILARMANRLSLLLLAAVVVSSFITIVVKVLGLMLIFSSNGPLNRLLLATGLIDQPVTIVGTIPGVILGLMYYTLGFAVLLFYSVIATVPRALEEAAEVHGASRLAVFTQVVLPLCRPGLAAGALMVFNVSMGGFSSTALIGAGKVLTLPIVIQRTVLLETSYGSGAALAVLLMATVLAINLCSAALLFRARDQVLA